MLQSIVKKIEETANEAVAADDAKEWSKAARLFKEAAQMIDMVFGNPRPDFFEPNRQLVAQKGHEYLDRYEEIMKHLASSPPASASASASASAAALAAGGVHEVVDVQRAERPDVRFSDIVGNEEAVTFLRTEVLLSVKQPQAFRLKSKGLLMYGPPGTGKTEIARALAGEAACAFFNVNISEMVSKWVGDSEKNVAALFTKAMENAPSILFFDEIDALMGDSGDETGSAKLRAQILSSWEGFDRKDDRFVFVIGATNKPQSIEPAYLRRLGTHLYVGLPSAASRAELVRRFLVPDMISTEQLAEVARATERYSGSNIKALVTAAQSQARRLVTVESCRYDVSGDLYVPNSCPECLLTDIDECMWCGSAFVKMEDLPDGKLGPVPCTFADLMAAVETVRPECSPDMEREFLEWGRNHRS